MPPLPSSPPDPRDPVQAMFVAQLMAANHACAAYRYFALPGVPPALHLRYQAGPRC